MSSSSDIRVRFAPSPTGYLHVGGARTALYAYLYAKKYNGTFILRVEDTDLERSTEESMRMQMQDLKWLGLDWQEGVDSETLKNVGEFGPYRQSQRQDIYQKYADDLLERQLAYYCFLSDEEIDQQKELAKKEGRPPHINSPYRDWPLQKALDYKKESSTQPVIRFKVPKENREYILNDLVRGQVKFQSEVVGDFVLIRSNGMPVYNFCCVIDDSLMKISHVFRAEEHLSNSLRQMMIYEAFNFERPQFGHLSIILGSDRQKLSKRHGATSVNDYNEQGFLPEAMNNFLALLGWSSPKAQEILSMKELVEQFDTDRLNSASAVFDETKLKWVNATHLRALDHKTLWEKLQPYFLKHNFDLPTDLEWQSLSLGLMKTSMETLADAVELFRPLSKGTFQLSEKAKEVLSWESTRPVIEKWVSLVKKCDKLTEEAFGEIQQTIKTECQVKGKNLFMPIRVAVIGQPHGAEVKLLVPLMEKSDLLERAQTALKSCP